MHWLLRTKLFPCFSYFSQYYFGDLYRNLQNKIRMTIRLNEVTQHSPSRSDQYPVAREKTEIIIEPFDMS